MPLLPPKLYRLLEPGANLSPPVEWVLSYGCVLWYGTLSGSAWGNRIQELALWNAQCQLVLFVVVVQMPTLITGHMSYVDLGWPAGLALIGLNVLWFTDDHDGGSPLRVQLAGGAIFVHGLRMLLGALYLFYPYVWTEDLPRYQYAKQRWIQHTGSDSLWWLKQQHDTMMQCMANCVVLVAPILIMATNPRETISGVEMLGFVCWCVSWFLENWCDCGKRWLELKAEHDQDSQVHTAVLGFDEPYNSGLSFWFWSVSRHPNYFFEWMCWNSFVLMALPSAVDLAVANQENNLAASVGVFVVLFQTTRMFYDCLIYWTGAAPAESRSVSRRPNYKEYQRTTNVFFPIHLPWFDHHKTPGWPLVVNTTIKDD